MGSKMVPLAKSYIRQESRCFFGDWRRRHVGGNGIVRKTSFASSEPGRCWLKEGHIKPELLRLLLHLSNNYLDNPNSFILKTSQQLSGLWLRSGCLRSRFAAFVAHTLQPSPELYRWMIAFAAYQVF